MLKNSQESNFINLLPQDVLKFILSFLEVSNLDDVKLVCKFWKLIVENIFQFELKTIHPDFPEKLFEQMIKNAASLKLVNQIAEAMELQPLTSLGGTGFDLQINYQKLYIWIYDIDKNSSLDFKANTVLLDFILAVVFNYKHKWKAYLNFLKLINAETSIQIINENRTITEESILEIEKGIFKACKLATIFEKMDFLEFLVDLPDDEDGLDEPIVNKNKLMKMLAQCLADAIEENRLYHVKPLYFLLRNKFKLDFLPLLSYQLRLISNHENLLNVFDKLIHLVYEPYYSLYQKALIKNFNEIVEFCEEQLKNEKHEHAQKIIFSMKMFTLAKLLCNQQLIGVKLLTKFLPVDENLIKIINNVFAFSCRHSHSEIVKFLWETWNGNERLILIDSEFLPKAIESVENSVPETLLDTIEKVKFILSKMHLSNMMQIDKNYKPEVDILSLATFRNFIEVKSIQTYFSIKQAEISRKDLKIFKEFSCSELLESLKIIIIYGLGYADNKTLEFYDSWQNKNPIKEISFDAFHNFIMITQAIKKNDIDNLQIQPAETQIICFPFHLLSFALEQKNIDITKVWSLLNKIDPISIAMLKEYLNENIEAQDWLLEKAKISENKENVKFCVEYLGIKDTAENKTLYYLALSNYKGSFINQSFSNDIEEETKPTGTYEFKSPGM